MNEKRDEVVKLLLLQVTTGINTGDIIFQLFFMLVVISIPVFIIFLLVQNKKNNRLKRIEEKLDRIDFEQKNEK
ncbi:hypothetical protein ACFSCX_12860 [Bacillus salitolerans]|uniref:DUF4083 domain-containing protein n=1 Tax=Bacillus salitolerans TaxID=1437434 RepID=A0ABW4LQT6_9BACI